MAQELETQTTLVHKVSYLFVYKLIEAGTPIIMISNKPILTEAIQETLERIKYEFTNDELESTGLELISMYVSETEIRRIT